MYVKVCHKSKTKVKLSLLVVIVCGRQIFTYVCVRRRSTSTVESTGNYCCAYEHTYIYAHFGYVCD